MQSKTKSLSPLAIFILAIGFAFIKSAFTWTFQNWQLMASTQLLQEDAVKECLTIQKSLQKKYELHLSS